MARLNSETVTTFGEVLHSANTAYSQGNRTANADNQLMIYFQGMKVYVPDGFQVDTLLSLIISVIFIHFSHGHSQNLALHIVSSVFLLIYRLLYHVLIFSHQLLCHSVFLKPNSPDLTHWHDSHQGIGNKTFLIPLQVLNIDVCHRDTPEGSPEEGRN